MSELLIPFGIHKENNRIVEPEDATKGRACNCICPGCKAPLLARHPKVNRDHFAHDSKHKDAKPEEECPFSSAVAVAMMAREIAPQLQERELITPYYDYDVFFECCLNKVTTVHISKPVSVCIDEVYVNVRTRSHHFDFKLMVSGYPIYVDLIYKGKPAVPLVETELSEEKAGVLSIDCDFFLTHWDRRERNQRFSEGVIAFILKWGVRSWHFHPRQTAKIRVARELHKCSYGYDPDTMTVFREPNEVEPNQPVVSLCQKENIRTKGTPQYCVMCQQEWEYRSSESNKCPGCGTHIFSRKF